MPPVKKRQVFYISGFDPRGVQAYYQLFAEECAKQAIVNHAAIAITPRRNANNLSSTWQTTNTTQGEPVTTTFEFLRWDDIVRAHWHGGYFKLFLLGLKTHWYWVSPRNRGYLTRIRRLSRWSYLLGILPAVLLVLIPALTLMAAYAGHQLGKAVPALAPWPSILLSVLCACSVLGVAVELERRLNFGWMLRSFGFMREYCSGGVPEFDTRIKAFAARIAAHIQASDDDEIIVVGHSSGANIAVSALAHVLSSNPGIAASERPLCLLTLGATIPMQGLLPASREFRDQLAQVAATEAWPWVDISSPHDIASFALHNPVTASGVTINGQPAQRPVS